MVAGHTSANTGGSVVVDSLGRVEIVGNIVSGGDVAQVFDEEGTLLSETVTRSDEAGTVHIESEGQVYRAGSPTPPTTGWWRSAAPSARRPAST
ncbi:hypothetical protein HK414_16040 [Ramlibacter terrae]|uniref:Uncharacterized protein n=1 Tax=Ramlibacter terrae TaxID=2732511 RepID=A0ABX6P3N1_9BURK|nr:hypothetical protein HK414_16040 [Ramlibacter terrae]